MEPPPAELGDPSSGRRVCGGQGLLAGWTAQGRHGARVPLWVLQVR